MIIPKAATKTFIKNFLIFGLIVCIADDLLGSLICRNIIGAILWPLACLAVMWFTSIGPFAFAIYRAQPQNAPLVRSVQKAKQEAEERAYVAATSPKVGPETLALRAQRIDDIRCCMTDNDFGWDWADVSTISRLYLFRAENRCIVFPATIVVDDNNRVSHIDATVDGVNIRLCNHPYLETLKQQAKLYDAPILAFMEAIPDAVWYWDSYPSSIIVSSKTKGFRNCPAKLKRAADGSISSMLVTLPDGKEKRVMKSKRQPNSSTGKTPKGASRLPVKDGDTPDSEKRKPTPIEGAERIGDDLSTTIVMAPPMADDNEQVDISPEAEFEGLSLLKPMQDPPIDDAIAKRNAEQIAQDMSGTIAEIAMAAEAQGENSIVIAWPEGIQTQREAEFLADYYVHQGCYYKAEVNANNSTLTLYFLEQD